VSDSQEVTIIRSPKSKEDPYVRVDRNTAQRDRKTGIGLSFGARGLMLYLLSKPLGWKVKHVDLQKEGDIGRDALNTILRELLDAGYVDRQKVRRAGGVFAWLVTVYELPSMNPSFKPETTDQCGKSAVDDQCGLSSDGKPALVDGLHNKDRARAPVLSVDHKELVKKEDKAKARKPRLLPPEIKLFKQVTRKLPRAPVREDVIKALGGTPNVDFLKECFKEWIKRGHNEFNLAWLFTWYADGAITPVRGHEKNGQSEKSSATNIRPRLRKAVNE
jgi:hypothetical protein